MARAKAGRKRKDGKRTKGGALARAMVRDLGCDGVQRRRAMFAAPPVFANDAEGVPRQVRSADPSQTFDAIGRAWSAGLLGYRADALRDGARKIATQYWRTYGEHVTPDSLARHFPSTPRTPADVERTLIIEQALNDTLTTVRRCGHDVRRAFDQLVIDINPDCGPAWLDRLILARRASHAPDSRDLDMMRLALDGLQRVA